MPWLSIKLWALALFSFCIAEKDHGIVYPRMLESRSATGERMLKINDGLTLTLQKSKVFADDFLFSTTENNEPIDYYVRAEDAERDIYHDPSHMASVKVTDDDGVEVEGILGERLRVKPLPLAARNSEGLKAHRLFEIDVPEAREHMPHDYGSPNKTKNIVESRAGATTYEMYEIPMKIYPEVHVVADSEFSKGFKYIVADVISYFAVLVNAANLRYKSLVFPEVQLRISGITMNKSPQDEPYIVNVPKHSQYRNILFKETLDKFNQYMKTKSVYKTSDIVFLVTAKNMSEWVGTQLQSWTGGYAYVGTACSDWKVGMCEDRPTSFYGAYVFSHELAHNLGCNHDGDEAGTWVKGHIGSSDCPWEDGYLMSYKMKDERQYAFSYCCQREIRNLYNRPEFRCLRERNPKKRIPKSSYLPGGKTSLDNYCKRVYMYELDVRANLTYGTKGVLDCKVQCLTRHSWWKLGVVDGTPCSNDGKKACILGKCIPYKRKTKSS
ncbi:venom metalloproteinase antarease-like TtrivMP_A [Ixodes scapularis]|uniref:venom metalloproteinase antarease-like TtrivMP_A n=1 Tax=Ixodes scapularis TaxID=6945 RepID=UPI001A9E0E31|nr:venom metalloproteinase antarease-like TtrivMP_A [Ixodes scapularis]